jgi:hypothetical protein
MHGEQRNAYMVLVGKPEEIKPRGNHFFRLEGIIEADREDILSRRGLD